MKFDTIEMHPVVVYGTTIGAIVIASHKYDGITRHYYLSYLSGEPRVFDDAIGVREGIANGRYCDDEWVQFKRDYQ